MNAAEAYAARIDAVLEQRTRLRGAAPPADPWAGQWAHSFRADPRRPLDANLEIVASYLVPEDVLIDVGGGAGRLSLPLALRFREVVDVDGSAAMGVQFKESAREAGIENVRFVHGAWPNVDGVQGTAALVANVTYFVRDIVPFIEKLQQAAPRRVMITVWSSPPPCRNAELYRLVYGEDEIIAPSYRELLPVLWELGIVPDVRLLPLIPQAVRGAPATTREEALANAATTLANEQWAHWPASEALLARIRGAIEPHFKDLFERTAEGFRPRWVRSARELLITWEPG